MTPTPLVSVVLPVRNGERFLAQALASVIAQTWRPLDVVVVDGHSTDGTADIAQSFPGVRYLPQHGRGIGAGYNTGVAEARGQFISFLSYDDVWTPDKTALQMALIQTRPDIGFAVGHAQFFLEPGSEVPAGFRSTWLQGTHAACIPETLLARREVFESVGRFDVSLSTGHDVDWFARARDLGVVHAMLPDVLVHKRVHDTNASLNDGSTNANLLDVVRRSLARKRQPPRTASR